MKAICFRKWKCGFYTCKKEAERDKFFWCLLCANFIRGREEDRGGEEDE